MTESTEDECMTMMNAFTDALQARLGKLEARPTRSALRNLLFISMLDTGLTLVPDHYDDETEDDIEDDDPTGDGDMGDTMTAKLNKAKEFDTLAHEADLIDLEAKCRIADALDRINSMLLRLEPYTED